MAAKDFYFCIEIINMKYLLNIVLIFFLFPISYCVYSQQDDTTKYLKFPNFYGTQQPRYWATKVLRIPNDTIYTKSGLASKNGVFYFGNGIFWQAVGSGGGGGGEANTASNLSGNGIGLFKTKVGVDLQFKRLKSGTGITITDNTDSVTISSTACGTGEVTEIIFRVGDYGHPQIGDNAMTRSIFNGAYVEVYRGGELMQRDDPEYGFSHSGSTITNVPVFTGTERMTIRRRDAGCFSTEALRPVLIIDNGESLPSGWGSNSSDSATATERGVRRMKILRGDTKFIEHLNIGNDASDDTYNNYRGIAQGGNETFARTHHGLELGFANKYDSNAFDGRPVYWVKCSRGGTRILDWRKTGTTGYYDSLMLYVDTAVAQIIAETGMEPIVFMLWECGVNDQFAGMNGAAWEDTVKTYFNDLRTQFNSQIGIDTTYILMFKLHAPIVYVDFNDEMDDIQADDTQGITFSVATTNAVITCEDGNCVTHWGYTGQRNYVTQYAMTKISELLLRYQ
jgi:hypothetical protein